MISTETMIKRINEEIEKLKQKDILVKVKMPVSEENKFFTYSTHELNSVSYQVIYAPKKDRKSTRLNSSHKTESRMPSSA